jgi:Flp pilus assembly pilin Flp
MTRVLLRLARAERALAAVEFALIAPLLVLLLCGFMEYAHVSSARTRLEGATMRAARAVAATDCPARREEIMRTTVTAGMTDIPSPNGGQVEITTRSYSERFGDVGQPEPFADANGNGRWDTGEAYTDVNGNGQYDSDMGTAGSIGGAGEVVSYSARYRVATLFGFLSQWLGQRNFYDIEASTVIRNEPIFTTAGCS